MAIGNLKFVDYPAPENAAEINSEVTASNAISIARALDDAISSMNAVADQLKNYDFSWSAANLPHTFTQVHYGGVTPPSINVAGADAPPAVSVSNIDVPDLPAAPDYTDRSTVFSWNEALWDMELLDAAKAKLMQDLLNGGYGIEPADELPLWERARERELLNGETAIQEVTRQAAARGFSLPPGALAMQIQAAQKTALEKNSSVSRDIALKRADMYVENRRFTIEQAKEVQRVINEYINAYFNRQLDAAKAQLDGFRLSYEVYQAELQAFTAKIGAIEAGVRTKALAADQRIRVYAAQISKYEADLRFNIDKARLDIERYSAQITDARGYLEAQSRSVAGATSQAEATARTAIANAQVAIEAIKARMGSLQAAAELYVAPANALSELAQAYIQSNQAITAVIEDT